MKKRVGFIGLGAMGKPMAMNILKAGYEICVFDINREAAVALEADGAKAAKQPREVAANSDVVLTMLPDSPEVEEVFLGKEGLLAGGKRDLVLVDSSTTDPETIMRIGLEARNVGVNVLDAPVGGGVPNAIKGNLIMLVGGDLSVVESCRDILETVGERIIYVGGLGSGKTLKLVNNLMMSIYILSLVEGFNLADKSGLEREKLIGLLKENLMRFFENHTKRILEGNTEPGFRTKLGHKDVKLALKMGERCNAFLPLASLSKELLQLGINLGMGDKDWTSISSIYRHIGK